MSEVSESNILNDIDRIGMVDSYANPTRDELVDIDNGYVGATHYDCDNWFGFSGGGLQHACECTDDGSDYGCCGGDTEYTATSNLGNDAPAMTTYIKFDVYKEDGTVQSFLDETEALAMVPYGVNECEWAYEHILAEVVTCSDTAEQKFKWQLAAFNPEDENEHAMEPEPHEYRVDPVDPMYEASEYKFRLWIVTPQPSEYSNPKCVNCGPRG
jgi:hypothetical protein